MTVLEQTRAQVRPAGPPRVDLLPPEIAEQRRLRRVQAGLGGGVLATLGLVAVAALLAAADADRADADLRDSQAEQGRLQAEAARYAAVPAVYAQVEGARATRAQAMGQEVRWSGYLDDLTRTVPGGVWLTNVTASLSAPTASAGSAPSAPSVPGAPAAAAGLGRVQFSGRAFSHDDLAAFLVALEAQRGNASPYFSSSTKKGAGGVVEFAATVELDQEAASGRFTSAPGGR